jgi:C4-dicarboxylate transporter, DcuC family
VPLVPLAILFLTAPPFQLLNVPPGWLVGAKEGASLLKKAGELLNDPAYRDAAPNPFDARLIGAAMLIGTAVAALTDRRAAPRAAAAFFEGAGYAFTHIISLIAAAACFGEGVKSIGLDTVVGQMIAVWPHLLLPGAGLLSLGFGVISGSGSAVTQSLFGFFAGPGGAQGVSPAHVGAVVALGAAAGRTMSLVAAVTLMCASLTETNPTELVRRVAPPILAGMAAVILAGMLMKSFGWWAAPAAVPAAASARSHPWPQCETVS